MYAVIKSGGHQYKVSQGDTIRVDSIAADVGSKIKFSEVLMIGGDHVKIGKPLVAGAFVEATVKNQTRNDKEIIFKYRRTKNYKVKRGHKQPVTVVEIGKISG